MKKALFLSGGWDGHTPDVFVQLFAGELARHGFTVEIEKSLGCLADVERLKTFALIFPCWTMGALADAESKGLQEAVRSGVGLAGIHGGMGDAFRGNLDYEWMTGGHFVGHPYIGEYTVSLRSTGHPIVAGLPPRFAYQSEQYYMLVDPGLEVLADTEYVYEGRSCRMPVAWTKSWGAGRVFYCALGHAAGEFSQFPDAFKLTVQGLLWAARVA